MEPSFLSDDALVEQAGQGDAQAATALVERHADKIFAVCFRTLRDRQHAEDAVQETFVNLWTNASQWRSDGGKLEAWLYRVAVNNCLSMLRKQRREAPQEAAPEQVDGRPRPDDDYLAAERRVLIDKALLALPDRQRAAIALCHFEDLSNIDAAAAMEISVEALESLLSRGRRKLRALLIDEREYLTGMMRDDTAN